MPAPVSSKRYKYAKSCVGGNCPMRDGCYLSRVAAADAAERTRPMFKASKGQFVSCETNPGI